MTDLLYKKFGAPRQNRTAITGLQNQCTTIVLVGRIVGGATETRTQKPAFTDRRISNPLQYHYGTAPDIWLPSVGSNHGHLD